MTQKGINTKSTTVIAILMLTLCVVACNRLGRSSSGERSNGTSPATTSGPPFERTLNLATPRALNYANLKITVTKAVISNRAPDTTQSDDSNPATADVTLQVLNTLNQTVRIRNGQWQLKLGNGSVYKAPFDETFEARDTQERKISFRVPLNADWPGAQLALDEQDKEPASVPLSAPLPQNQYPAKFTATGDATLKEPDTVSYSISGGEFDLDAFGQRASVGKKFLMLSVKAECKETAGGGCFVSRDSFRIIVDGQPIAPENLDPISEAITPQGAREFTAAFLVPAAATTYQLEVGEANKQTARIPFDVKGAPA